MVSHVLASWNQLDGWLRQLERLALTAYELQPFSASVSALARAPPVGDGDGDGDN